jgi:hypothetical protein
VQALRARPEAAVAVGTAAAGALCAAHCRQGLLSLFTTLTTFGSPRDVTLDELCVELFYPADARQAMR